MGIICGKCTKCLDLWLAAPVGGFPPSRRSVFILLRPALYYSSEEPMNILKANRAINPSKINLSAEMLHFYFRGTGCGPAQRPAPSRPSREGVGVHPTAGPVHGHAWKMPPHTPPPAQHRTHGHRDEPSRWEANGTRVPKMGETTFPERAVEMPFGMLLLGSA